MSKLRIVERGHACAQYFDGCTVATARKRERTDPDWPRPRKINARRIGYLYSEIEHWLRTRPVGGGSVPIEAIQASMRQRAAELEGDDA